MEKAGQADLAPFRLLRGRDLHRVPRGDLELREGDLKTPWT